MDSKFDVPCRLFIILAREAPVGLIFRRGPSKWTQIIKWNTANDTFEYGAWFNGQIYPKRSDISPDGSKLIYFATHYSSPRELQNNNRFPSEWTGISKTPWLTALAAWANPGTYFGGGLFETNTSVWLNADYRWRNPETNYEPQGLEVSYEQTFWEPDWHLLYRLERDGWKAIEKYPAGAVLSWQLQPDGSYDLKPTDPNAPRTPHIRTVHEKVFGHGAFTLILTSPRNFANGVRKQTYEIRNNQRKTIIALPDVVWADLDQQGRLVLAREGKLLASEIMDGDELCVRELADFNGLRPRRTKAPDWAREW